MRLIGLAIILALGLVLAPLAAAGQQAEKVRRIGFLSATILDSQTQDGGHPSKDTSYHSFQS
jgi:hypothetical protein